MQEGFESIGEGPSPRLNRDFFQALWYDAENFIITRRQIEIFLLRHFLSKHNEPIVGYRRVKRGKQKLIGTGQDALAGLILGRIPLGKLNQLHKEINKEVNPQEKERLANGQVEMIVNAIKESLEDSKITEEQRLLIKSLLE